MCMHVRVQCMIVCMVRYIEEKSYISLSFLHLFRVLQHSGDAQFQCGFVRGHSDVKHPAHFLYS